MSTNKYTKFLEKLGFSPSDFTKPEDDIYSYSIGVSEAVLFIYTPEEHDVFEKHKYLWNQNSTNTFVAVGNKRTHIIHAKQKPQPNKPLARNCVLKTFDYGVNTEGFEKEKIQEISKDFIDATYFFNFVASEIGKKKKQEVDKDLLLNLIALRNDLVNISNDEETIHLLILRSLFIKYLEDRGIYEIGYWEKVLETNEPLHLVVAFKEIKKINGDIFEEKLTEDKIQSAYLPLLHKFFTTDYRSSQQSLFPYLFDQIPIQLISHVYEAFLKSHEKKDKGIYYTPAFVVNFMLSQTLNEKLKNKPDLTVLDPAVGSGAFLVESFRTILKNRTHPVGFEEKKQILANQLYGIDVDKKALQIAAFSLYLALIETEEPDFIRKQIEDSHPILPSLIGKTLIRANTITDDVFSAITFDCIMSNPPWGSVVPNEKNYKERIAIGENGKKGTMPEYKNVSDLERSQAFLVRVKKWCNENTMLALIVKNSIFLNDNSNAFRKELLNTYQINTFYELSNYNKILFKKQKIDKINDKAIEIGASEPCAILVFELLKGNNNKMKYISPKLNGFSEAFQIIHYTQRDINEIDQTQFIEDDLLWRVLVNGDLEDYKLIKSKINNDNNFLIKANSGYKPSNNMEPIGEPIIRNVIEPEKILRYKLLPLNEKFNINQKMERQRKLEIFEGTRLVMPIRPLQSDYFKIRATKVNDNNIHKQDIACIRVLEENNESFYDYYLGLINSSLFGYFLYHLSVQWGKGAEKRSHIRISDIEKLPILKKDKEEKELLSNLVKEIYKSENESYILNIENQIDELVFKFYDLTLYQKEIIYEFFQVRVERAKFKQVKSQDIEKYIEAFVSSFNLMLKKGKKLSGQYKISANVGAVACFRIVDESFADKPKETLNLDILHFVKKKQIRDAELSKILNEDKVKIYDNEFMYIIKSNQFKDWTVRQAMRDAREEIGLLLSKLPDNHE